MTLPRAVVIFVMANAFLAWLGLAGPGGPSGMTTAAADETVTVAAGSVPPYALK